MNQELPSPLLRPLDDAVASMSPTHFFAFLQENAGAEPHNLALVMRPEEQQEFLTLYASVQKTLAFMQEHYLHCMQRVKSAVPQVSNEELQ